MLLQAAQILDYIPQRPPIVMIDTLLEAGDVTVTSLHIRSDLLFVENGHLTEPGLLENIAQTAAIRAGYFHKQRNEPVPLGFIGSFKNIKINSLPEVGQTIRTEVSLKHEVLETSIFDGWIVLEETVLVECELKVFVKKD